MRADCTTETFEFGKVAGRKICASFDGGAITSDAGALLLGATDKAIRLVDRFARCFRDYRKKELVEHTVATLAGQRIFGLCLGYEDLNDHDSLRHDPLFAVLAGKLAARRKDCGPIAGKSTLNRLELSKDKPSRYHKISFDNNAANRLFVDLFLEAHAAPPEQIILDLDATDDPVHGAQEGRFFHGYYGHYCYLPLYICCGQHLLLAKLRRANTDASAGAKEDVETIVAQIRARWPKTRIILRADSGFTREPLMNWCEGNGLYYLFGLAKNAVLIRALGAELAEVASILRATGKKERRFKELTYKTRKSWSKTRRVVGKAEWLEPSEAEKVKGETQGRGNPRFVVTNLLEKDAQAKELYETHYCARGEMENRIKECQLDLFADRTSAATMRANQLRLTFSSMAYVLMSALRRMALCKTQLANATTSQIRLKLLKIGAVVTASVRRVKFALASAYPYAEVFRIAHAALSI